jgi:hypothetical protein
VSFENASRMSRDYLAVSDSTKIENLPETTRIFESTGKSASFMDGGLREQLKENCRVHTLYFWRDRNHQRNLKVSGE